MRKGIMKMYQKMNWFRKKVTVFALAGVMAAGLSAPAFAAHTQTTASGVTEGSAVAASTAIVKAAAVKKGWVKKSGKWYYYKSGKKVTGLKKISGKYYYFNKKGVMQSGKQSINGFTYYFKKTSDKKAAALTNTTKKIGKKTYYFSSKGRGFLSVGKKKGNQAVAAVMDGVKFSSGMTNAKKQKKIYTYIVNKFSYMAAEDPDLSGKAWIYTCAYNMVYEGDAKCFNYAALTGLCFRALGFDAKILTGTALHPLATDSASQTQHAWVVITKNGTDYVYDTLYDDVNGKSGLQFFGKTYAQIKSSQGSVYTVEKTF